MLPRQKKLLISNRFRGLLPIVVDVETTGLNPQTDAILEIAAVVIDMDAAGKLFPLCHYEYQVEVFAGANVDPEALLITGIDPTHPLRYAIPVQQALRRLFAHIKQHLEITHCRRGILVGHNAWFDLAFIQAALKRNHIKTAPIHSFTTFDTATLAGVALGETVLAKAVRKAGIPFDVTKAHSAIYDAFRTAELFCYINNRWHSSIK